MKHGDDQKEEMTAQERRKKHWKIRDNSEDMKEDQKDQIRRTSRG